MTDTTSDAQAAVSHRRVLKIALPIVLSNATVPILGAVDVGVVGQLGAAAPIGAVGLGAVILSTVYWIFGFLRMGTVGLVGQAAGAGDDAEVSAWLTRALLVALAGGLTLIVLQPLIFWGALTLADASDEVTGLARSYLTIRIWTAPAAIAVYALTGWLVAMERTGGVFWVQLVMNGTNILLDLLFVLVLDWGVPGVAVATVIAELTGAALGLWFCRAAFANLAWREWPRIFERSKLVRMALLNTDILLRSAMLMIIFSSLGFIGARLGDVTLAANQVLIQFMYITAYAMDGFAFAAETLIARAFGRGDRAYVRRAALVTSVWGLLICVFMATAFGFVGGWGIDLMAKNADVQQTARQFLPYMVVAPLLGCAAWMFDGIFIGATRSKDMRNMMALSFLIYWLALAVLLPTLGNHGLWLALLISFIARGVTLGLRYPALEAAAGKA
ncbi:MATE family efflux transporter [Roseobacter cerasinus]|uniref:MATE family efflux transporter n=1 Tax=Roseobacter cerasinus TaxID=2602289 RepID=A0A640VT94_9RHOB|nr:MATE family efflux transporter [Roseobacter cerasinus]GFE51259.1 MATE family efflux transporter [Roseobacter cerasinus]